MVIIVGKISVPTAVVVHRNLTVKGMEKATVTSLTYSLFPFVMGSQGIALKIFNIIFNGIGIVRIEDEGKFLL